MALLTFIRMKNDVKILPPAGSKVHFGSLVIAASIYADKLRTGSALTESISHGEPFRMISNPIPPARVSRVEYIGSSQSCRPSLQDKCCTTDIRHLGVREMLIASNF